MLQNLVNIVIINYIISNIIFQFTNWEIYVLYKADNMRNDKSNDFCPNHNGRGLFLFQFVRVLSPLLLLTVLRD